jgi:hypothetical protein
MEKQTDKRPDIQPDEQPIAANEVKHDLMVSTRKKFFTLVGEEIRNDSNSGRTVKRSVEKHKIDYSDFLKENQKPRSSISRSSFRRSSVSKKLGSAEFTVDGTVDESVEDNASMSHISAKVERSPEGDTDSIRQDIADLEANSGFMKPSDRNAGESDNKKRWLTFGNACKVLSLWGIIVGITLLLSGKMMLPERSTPSCSLCPSGTSVTHSEIEIILNNFSCTSEESSCSFHCESLSLPRVYTCGEVEKLAIESDSECSDSSDSCAMFQQASSQCCFRDSNAKGNDVGNLIYDGY